MDKRKSFSPPPVAQSTLDWSYLMHLSFCLTWRQVSYLCSEDVSGDVKPVACLRRHHDWNNLIQAFVARFSVRCQRSLWAVVLQHRGAHTGGADGDCRCRTFGLWRELSQELQNADTLPVSSAGIWVSNVGFWMFLHTIILQFWRIQFSSLLSASTSSYYIKDDTNDTEDAKFVLPFCHGRQLNGKQRPW